MHKNSNATKKNIVLLEDDRLFRETLALGLRHNFPECNIYEFSDGRDAVALMQKIQLDLVVLDLMVPGISGIDVLRQVMKEKLGGAPKIAIVSSADRMEIVQGALKIGAGIYIGKSKPAAEIIATISNFLLDVESDDEKLEASDGENQVHLADNNSLRETESSKKNGMSKKRDKEAIAGQKCSEQNKKNIEKESSKDNKKDDHTIQQIGQKQGGARLLSTKTKFALSMLAIATFSSFAYLASKHHAFASGPSEYALFQNMQRVEGYIKSMMVEGLWTLKNVEKRAGDEIGVEIELTSTPYLAKLRALSSMDKVEVAKHFCPPENVTLLGSDVAAARIRVDVFGGGKKVTASFCASSTDLHDEL